MATIIPMVRDADGSTTNGFTGFSWTTLFFGFFPSLFRGHILASITQIVVALVTFGISTLVFPFFYNSWHRNWLISKGYRSIHATGLHGAAAPANNAVSSNVINVHVGNQEQPAPQASPAPAAVDHQVTPAAAPRNLPNLPEQQLLPPGVQQPHKDSGRQ